MLHSCLTIGLILMIYNAIAPPAIAYNWLSLALSSSSSSSSSHYSPAYHLASEQEQQQYELLCRRLQGLNPVQKAICEQHPYAMPSIGRGARDSIVECQTQFKYERWNCSERYEDGANVTFYGYQDLLGWTLRAGNRETAFVSAITSAGIVHAVTRGCSTGNLTECGCDNRPGEQHISSADNNKDAFSWGGCSDNFAYGIKFAKQFLDRFERDQFEKESDVRYLMNLHNNEVGREAISQNMKRQCRCHGVSGSCEFKTCWLQMPKFTEIGDMLKQRYNHFAVQVAKRAKKRLRRKDRSERKLALRFNEMAYVYRSPNYCERNDTVGILGTQGRECNQSSLSADSCDLLCCGRGYNTREEVRTSRCSCKFVWCCYVKCKECAETVQVHTCK